MVLANILFIAPVASALALVFAYIFFVNMKKKNKRHMSYTQTLGNNERRNIMNNEEKLPKNAIWYYQRNNQQTGPVDAAVVERLIGSGDVTRSTKVWREGMAEWQPAMSTELGAMFPKNVPPTVSPPNIPPPAPTMTGNVNMQNTNYSQPLTTSPVYEEHFNVKNLNSQEIDSFKKNLFFDTFSTGVGILLHFLTLGIFTTIYCGLKHSKLPKVKSDDFSGGKAIGFLFIPFFNFYWLFVFWRRLAMRINFQFRLRNEQPPISLGLATTVCILAFVPYLGVAINYLILIPILFSQIQSASNKLANENMRNNQYATQH